MQGLPGVAGMTDPEGSRSGWQKSPGEVGDRDVKFFDAALERIQKIYKTDPNRVYVLGHSNGSRFVERAVEYARKVSYRLVRIIGSRRQASRGQAEACVRHRR